MNYLLLIGVLILSTPAWGALFGLDAQDLERTSLLVNGGFENGESKWTASGSSVLDTVTSGANLAVGSRTGSWDATAAAETLTSAQVTVPVGYYNKLCQLNFLYKGGDNNLTAQVIDGTLAIVSSQQLVTVADFTEVSLKFSCPGSGTLAYRLSAGADAAILYLDSIYLGLSGDPVAANPIVYEEERSIGTVGSVANAKGSLVDGDFATPSLLAAFSLNGSSTKTSGTATANLTETDAPDYIAKGFFGFEQVASFNGVQDELRSSEAQFDLGTGAFSTGIWVKNKSRIVNTEGIIGQWGDASTNLSARIVLTGSTLSFQTSTNGTSVETNVDVTNAALFGDWVHVAMVYDGATSFKGYVNGQLAVSATVTSIFNSTVPFQIGTTEEDDTVRNLTGDLSEFFIYRSTLTDAQVNAIYSKRFSNHQQIAAGHVLDAASFPKSDLTGNSFFWNFTEGSGNSTDGSVNAKVLTNTGTTPYTGLDLYGVASAPYAANTAGGTATQYFSSADAALQPDGSSFCVGGWFALENWSSANQALLAGNSTIDNSGFLFRARTSNTIEFRIWDGTNISGNAGATSILTNGSWHHIVGCYRSSLSVDTYVDGVRIDSTSLTLPYAVVASTQFTVFTRRSDRVDAAKGRAKHIFFVKDNLTDEDIRKLYSARIDLQSSTTISNQDWSSSLWGREDSKINNQLSPDWLLDTTANSLYLDTGLPSGSLLRLKERDTGFTAYTVSSSVYNSGELSAAPSFPLNHGLPGRPLELVVWSEGQTLAGEWDQRRDLCSATSTQLNCDLSGLTIDGTHRVQLIASMTPGSTAVREATTTRSGLVDTAAQSFAGKKELTNGLSSTTVFDVDATDVELDVRTDGNCGIGNLCSGTYTPTTTLNSNLTSVSGFVTGYIRVGNIVTVWVRANVDPISSATTTSFNFSLPVASNFTSSTDGSGAGTLYIGNPGSVLSPDSIQIISDAGNDEMNLTWNHTSAGGGAVIFALTGTFTYIVK